MKKRRGLFEGPEWDGSRRKVDPDIVRFDEAFRFIAENIAVAPRVNTTSFLTEDHRILVSVLPGVAELWVYFWIAPDDNNCTLLWIESRGGQFAVRVG